MTENQPMCVFKTDSFPLIVLHPNEQLSEECIEKYKTAVVQQGVNFFMVKNNGICSYMYPIEKPELTIQSLFDTENGYDPENVYRLTEFSVHLSMDLLQYSMKYFKTIYNEHGTEAAVLLLFNKAKKEWRLLPVFQTGASGGSVRYLHPTTNLDSLKEGPEKDLLRRVLKDQETAALQNRVVDEYNELQQQGFAVFGTIHSHCDFGAFHSGTDDEDEADFEGLHITIGKCNSGWSFAARYNIRGAYFPLPINDVVGLSEEEFKNNLDVDHIEIDENDLELMKPNWLATQYKVTNAYNWPNKTTNLLQAQHDEREEASTRTTFQDLSKEITIIEDETIVLYNPVSRKIIVVPQVTYYTNANHFGHYQVITEINAPTDQLEVDLDSEHKSLMLFDVPALTGNHSKGVIQPARRIVNGD